MVTELSLTNDAGESVAFKGTTDSIYDESSGKTLTQLLEGINSFDIDKVYPVGSIYMNIANTNPGTLFGGTWEAIQDKFLLGTSSTVTGGVTGGYKSVDYTPAGTVSNHVLTTSEIPSHAHSIPSLSGTTNSTGAHTHKCYYDSADNNSAEITVFRSTETWPPNGGSLPSLNTESNGNHTHSVTTNKSTSGSNGSGGAHSHGFSGTKSSISVMPPYMTVYMWKRIE